MTTFYHYTDDQGFAKITGFESNEGRLLPSGIFVVRRGDLDYGTGWYITPLPPITSTDELLRHLWKSDRSMRPRTAYWLSLSVGEVQVEYPDPSRPFVALIRYFRPQPFVDGPSVSVWGSFGDCALLEAGGRRVDRADGSVEIITTYSPPKPVVAVEAFLAGISGVLALDWRQRQAILDFYKIDDPDDSFHVRFARLVDESDQLYREGNLTAALDAVQKAIQLDDSVAHAWDNRGAILAGLGRREDALIAYRRAIELDPKYVSAFRNAAASLNRLGRYHDALEMCDQALAIEPTNADVWTNKASAHDASGDEERALEALNRALALNPELPQAWNNKGGIILRQATEAAEQLKDNPQRVSTLITEATQCYCTALRCNRNYENARIGLREATRLALNTLPWTWMCEHAVWSAARIDNGCLQCLLDTLLGKGIEFHPQYGESMAHYGCAPNDSDAMRRVLTAGVMFVKELKLESADPFLVENTDVAIGTMLLVDALARSGMVRLPLRMGEVVTGSEVNVFETGLKLQVAKALGGAGVSLRRAGACTEAVNVTTCHAIYTVLAVSRSGWPT